MFKELYDVLPLYGQILLTVGIVFVGCFMAYRGFVDNAKKHAASDNAPTHDGPIPIWLMMGPMHDALQSIHEIAECNRTQTTILRDMDKTLERLDQGQKYTHYVLENLLRNQELAVPPPSRDFRYTRR